MWPKFSFKWFTGHRVTFDNFVTISKIKTYISLWISSILSGIHFRIPNTIWKTISLVVVFIFLMFLFNKNVPANHMLLQILESRGVIYGIAGYSNDGSNFLLYNLWSGFFCNALTCRIEMIINLKKKKFNDNFVDMLIINNSLNFE